MDFENLLQRLETSGNLRRIPVNSVGEGLDFTSNDYMGLAGRADLAQMFMDSVENRALSMSASASRLLAADQKQFAALEELLESLYGGQRKALLFNSGYHANTGLIPAFCDRHSLILADRLVHASIIDGIMLSRAAFQRFAHNSVEALENLLSANYGKYKHIMVVVESVYSMDGDYAPLEGIVALKDRYPGIMLYVDEAHAFGVNGRNGLGFGFRFPLEGVDAIVGTFGKAVASSGAFAMMSQTLHDVAVNCARSFIFSTALSPLTVAWTRFMVETLVGMDAEREHLHRLSAQLRKLLLPLVQNGESIPESHIQPFIVGDAARAVGLSKLLRAEGIKVLPIRKPTVPAGTERLRISLSASHGYEDVVRLANALKKHTGETEICK